MLTGVNAQSPDKISEFIENASDIFRPANAYNLTRLMATGAPHMMSHLLSAAVRAVTDTYGEISDDTHDKKENEIEFRALRELELQQARYAAINDAKREAERRSTDLRQHRNDRNHLERIHTAERPPAVHSDASPHSSSPAIPPRLTHRFNASTNDSGPSLIERGTNLVRESARTAYHAAGDAVEAVAGTQVRHVIGAAARNVVPVATTAFTIAAAPAVATASAVSSGYEWAKRTHWLPSWAP